MMYHNTGIVVFHASLLVSNCLTSSTSEDFNQRVDISCKYISYPWMAVHVEPWTWQQGVITFKSMWKQRHSMKIPGLHDMVEDVRWYYRLWDTSYQPWPVLTLLLKLTCSFEYRIVGYFHGVLTFITFMTSPTSREIFHQWNFQPIIGLYNT